MNKFWFFYVLLGMSLGGHSQQLLKEGIDNGGGLHVAGSFRILDTVGETVVAEKNQSGLMVSEGFISPELFAVLGVDDDIPFSEVVVYPNPVADILYISVPELTDLTWTLYDLNGKVLLEGNERQTQLQNITVSQLASGQYVLLVAEMDTNHSQMFKILKP
jgi:hypothetical protein